MDCMTRPAPDDDATAISAVILRALRETNASEYAGEIIDRIALSFSPLAVRQLMTTRKVFVGTIGNRVVGTASLEGSVVRTAFVAPDVQARGIGRLLMAEIDRAAREQHMPVLTLRSSVTAEAFYARLGFRAVHDSYHGDERTILMERSLDESL
ncbi:MAG: GNAT family N-acetyltransferase [Bradyrhizobium sp.]